jgi:hypothetical protein
LNVAEEETEEEESGAEGRDSVMPDREERADEVVEEAGRPMEDWRRMVRSW